MQWWERNSELDMDLSQEEFLVSGTFAATEGHTGARDMHWLTHDRMQSDVEDAEIKEAVDTYIREMGRHHGWEMRDEKEDEEEGEEEEEGEGEGEDEGESEAEYADDGENA